MFKTTKKSNVYTRTGDKGVTSLYCGKRIQKSEIIFDILGCLDELTSRIGMLCALTVEKKDIVSSLRIIQKNIQNINSIFATFNTNKQQKLCKIDTLDIEKLETEIDTIDSKNPKLTSFILPGINTMDSQAHLCRTQTRNVERHIWKLYHGTVENDLAHQLVYDILRYTEDLEIILKYINRLSDFFFVLARYLSL